jgi:G3E family GTPase
LVVGRHARRFGLRAAHAALPPAAQTTNFPPSHTPSLPLSLFLSRTTKKITGCSIQDELFGSFEQLLALADARGGTYDRIVLENSGVAEPQNIRDKFADAVAAGHPLASRVRLDTMVTIVDSATFVRDYASRAPLAARPDLGEGGTLRPVVDLLVEQVECADYVILNKTDQLTGGPAALASLHAIVAALNPLARIHDCVRGAVDVGAVFGRGAAPALVAGLNVEGQHRGAVAHAAALAAAEKAAEGEEGGEDHAHGGGCAVCAATGEDGRAAGGGHPAGGSAGGGCGHKHGDGGHDGHDGHGHGHHHHHHHDHKHDHNHGPECGADGAACTHDHKHGHGHGHKKKRQETTAASRFGIRSFVYARRRPFHPARLRELVLRWLPVATNAALEDGAVGGAGGGGDGSAPAPAENQAAAAAAAGAGAGAPAPSPIQTVLRSKGFLWMSHSHATAFYWSHAGQHFEIRDEGDWWAAVPDADWPADPAQRAVILGDFSPQAGVGDRRQEIVFIGAGMDEGAIAAQLDGALLDDGEMEAYTATFAASAPDPVHEGAPA